MATTWAEARRLMSPRRRRQAMRQLTRAQCEAWAGTLTTRIPIRLIVKREAEIADNVGRWKKAALKMLTHAPPSRRNRGWSGPC